MPVSASLAASPDLLAEEDTFRQTASVPSVPEITVPYRTVLASIALPEGFFWPSGGPVFVGDVGLQTFPALYKRPGSSEAPITVEIAVRVVPKDGNLCTVSRITNEAEARNISIWDGTFRLTKNVDYTVSYTVAGNTATVAIHFAGNYTGTVKRSFVFGSENSWVAAPGIGNWVAGSAPSSPSGTAAYGTPVFTYIVNGAEQTQQPSAPGNYILVACVAATSSYGELRAEIPFTIYAAVAPEVPGLEAVYRTRLSSVALPSGFSWVTPNAWVGNVGTGSFPALYVPADDESGTYSGGNVSLSVRVLPKDGNLCSISPITNQEQSRSIVITDGTYRLVKGTDYVVTSDVTGNLVTVTIHFMGNYTGTAERTFTFGTKNEWVAHVTMNSWIAGQPASAPYASAYYGTPQYTYYVNGTWTNACPSEPGTYICCATVPGTVYYPEISCETTFTIYQGTAPAVSGLEAVYGDALSDVDLPDGFSWTNPEDLVGDAGIRRHTAVYTPNSSQYSGGETALSVRVLPFPGSGCSISPVTNEAESRNIVVKNGDTVLTKGTDYSVVSSVDGNRVTVTIEFFGNYSGSVERSFTFETENAWVEPLTISDWVAGNTPSVPSAESKYGKPSFSYYVNGAWQAAPPGKAGTYTCRASVAATLYYRELTAETSFIVYEAVAPATGTLDAVYGDLLSSVSLPDGFAWTVPDQTVGDAGLRTFDAVYTSESNTYMGGTVGVQVLVSPKDGTGFRVSQITNEYEAAHLSVYDGPTQLVAGRDYSIVTRSDGPLVTVSIVFLGNYTGTIQRQYTLRGTNAWIVPLSMPSWVEGADPAEPRADAKFGAVQFSYFVDGVWQNERPSAAGTYQVKAEVAATEYYDGLMDTVSFQILPISDRDSAFIEPREGIDLEIVPASDSQGILTGEALTVSWEGIRVSQLLEMVTVDPPDSAAIIEARSKDGTALNGSDFVVTGVVLLLVSEDDPEDILDELLVAVRGDVLGTGIMSLSQLVRIASAYRSQMGGGGLPLSGAAAAAGDLNGDGLLSLSDLVREASLYRADRSSEWNRPEDT